MRNAELIINDMVDEEHRIMKKLTDKQERRNCQLIIEYLTDEEAPLEERMKLVEIELDYIIENEWSELQ